MSRLVLDTNVVAALRSPDGASAELLRRVRLGRHDLLMSVALCLEYKAVAGRRAHLRASGLAPGDVRVFVDGLVTLSELITPWFSWRPSLPDPGDEMVADAAIAGRADMIVTFNQKDFGPVSDRWPIAVCPPQAVLRTGG